MCVRAFEECHRQNNSESEERWKKLERVSWVNNMKLKVKQRTIQDFSFSLGIKHWLITILLVTVLIGAKRWRNSSWVECNKGIVSDGNDKNSNGNGRVHYSVRRLHQKSRGSCIHFKMRQNLINLILLISLEQIKSFFFLFFFLWTNVNYLKKRCNMKFYFKIEFGVWKCWSARLYCYVVKTYYTKCIFHQNIINYSMPHESMFKLRTVKTKRLQHNFQKEINRVTNDGLFV